MILFKTYIAPSGIEGNGLFAGEFIPIGAKFRVHDPVMDKDITPGEFYDLPPVMQDFVYKYSWEDEDALLHLALDDERYINHSTKANLLHDLEDHFTVIAARNIEEGEELTYDYRRFSHRDPTRKWLNDD